jgi:hypothetical protein
MTRNAIAERRVLFTADFDYKPAAGTTIAYRAGYAGLVRKECADWAIALGKAEYVTVAGAPSGVAATIARKRRRKDGDEGRNENGDTQ